MRFKEDDFGYTGLSGDQFFPPSDPAAFPAPAPAQYPAPIGPLPAPDHWQTGAAGNQPFSFGPAWNPGTRPKESLGDSLLTIGEVIAPSLSALTGIDHTKAFTGLRQAARQKHQDALQERQFQAQQQHQQFQQSLQAANQKRQAEQDQLAREQSGYGLMKEALKLQGPMREHFLKKGVGLAGLQMDDDLVTTILKADDEQKLALTEAMQEAAKQYGISGAVLSKLIKTDPETAVRFFNTFLEGRKVQLEQADREAVARIRQGGSATAGSQEGPGTPASGPTVSPLGQPSSTGLLRPDPEFGKTLRATPPAERGAMVDRMIEQIAAGEGVDPALLKTIARLETAGFDPDAVSPAGARGLMQFMPATAKRFGINPHDPIQAIQGAARYVRFLQEKFGDDPSLILAGYNAGEGNVQRHGGVPPFRETQGYVRKGLAYLQGLGQAQGVTQAAPVPTAVQPPAAVSTAPVEAPALPVAAPAASPVTSPASAQQLVTPTSARERPEIVGQTAPQEAPAEPAPTAAAVAPVQTPQVAQVTAPQEAPQTRTAPTGSTPVAPRTDKALVDLDRQIAESQRRLDEFSRLGGRIGQEAYQKEEATMNRLLQRKAMLESRLDQAENRRQQALKRDDIPGSPEFKAFAQTQIGQTLWPDVPAAQQTAIIEAYEEKKKVGEFEADRKKAEMQAEVSANKWDTERHLGYILAARHQGLELPADPEAAKAFVKQHKLVPRKEMDNADEKLMRERKEQYHLLNDLLQHVNVIERGPVSGWLQEVADRYGVDTQGLEARAAYRLVQAKVMDAAIHALTGAAASAKETKRLMKEMVSSSDNDQVATGKLKTMLGILRQNQIDDYQTNDRKQRFVDPTLKFWEETRQPESELDQLVRESAAPKPAPTPQPTGPATRVERLNRAIAQDQAERQRSRWNPTLSPLISPDKLP